MLALGGAAPVHASHDAPNGSGAEAYGLYVDAKLGPVELPIQQGPIAWANQDYPPGAPQPDEAEVLDQGPIPADGSLVGDVGVITTEAAALATPQGGASAEVANVDLLGSFITADLIRAQANATCTDAPNATGTSFVNLSVNGVPVTETPVPNTVIDLGVIRVILNEQHPAFDGRGIVVNAIHVISTSDGDEIFRGDIIVSHAMATVHCRNGAGTTGGDSPVLIAKDVAPASTTAGSQVTYTASITNDADEECLVIRVVDHLPPGFTPASTAGDLGTTFEQDPRPGGGIDVAVGSGTVIPAGETVTQTFVVNVGANVAPGTYWNNVEVFCSNLGNFIKGLDAPVTITAVTQQTAPPTTTATTSEAGGELPATGADWPSPALLLLLTAASALFYKAAAASKSDL